MENSIWKNPLLYLHICLNWTVLKMFQISKFLNDSFLCHTNKSVKSNRFVMFWKIFFWAIHFLSVIRIKVSRVTLCPVLKNISRITIFFCWARPVGLLNPITLRLEMEVLSREYYLLVFLLWILEAFLASCSVITDPIAMRIH